MMMASATRHYLVRSISLSDSNVLKHLYRAIEVKERIISPLSPHSELNKKR
jgi:hypothetical protein